MGSTVACCSALNTGSYAKKLPPPDCSMAMGAAACPRDAQISASSMWALPSHSLAPLVRSSGLGLLPGLGISLQNVLFFNSSITKKG